MKTADLTKLAADNVLILMGAMFGAMMLGMYIERRKQLKNE